MVCGALRSGESSTLTCRFGVGVGFGICGFGIEGGGWVGWGVWMLQTQTTAHV